MTPEDIIYAEAKMLENDGDFIGAANQYRRLAVITEKSAFYSLAAIALENAGRTTDAIAESRLAVKGSACSATAHKLLGRLLLDAEDYDAARQHLEQSLSLKVSASAFVYLAILHRKTHEYDKSIEYCHKAIECNSLLDEAYLNLALTCLASDQIEKARSAVQKALDVSPHYEEAMRLAKDLQNE